jgi:hypothetical protein
MTGTVSDFSFAAGIARMVQVQTNSQSTPIAEFPMSQTAPIRALKLTAAVIGVAVLTGVAYVAWVVSSPTAKPLPFDPIQWKKSAALDLSNDPGCFRGGMALELANSKLLVGKTSSEVIALLGDASKVTAGVWSYSVGQCGFGWEHNELALTFGAEDKVAQVIFN